MIDVHVHLMALPTPTNGCRMSRRMRRSPAVLGVALRDGLPLSDPETTNRRYVEQLLRRLGSSELVSGAVVLAMDGVYDGAGELDEGRTDVLISNDYVFQVAAAHPQLLPGVSVHPGRKDALDELERCFAHGAALVKWLPNAQAFDPADPRWRGFYRALARLGLPLLSHIGFEFSLIGSDQSVGNPERLLPALEEGVTVIAAHGCSSGVVYERHFGAMLDLARRFPNLYVDTSALSLPNRVLALLMLKRHPELFDRLLFGTDYPLPSFSYPALLAFSPRGFFAAVAARSSFDRMVRVLEAVGVRPGADFDSIRHR
ncbi:MAG: amidohydrolase family protein [Elusimicrobiota bacterium]